MPNEKLCPCQSQKPFNICCEPLLLGKKYAKTAEALMRSRYTAYTLHNSEYLLQSWHKSTRPTHIDHSSLPAWCGLTIRRTEGGGTTDNNGVVEFVAIAPNNAGGLITLNETSTFQKQNNKWLYVAGEIKREPTTQKAGRNTPCPCGSGRKFKKCCILS